MRHIVIGSTHFSMFILKAIRESDPSGIIYTVERSPEVAEVMSKLVSGRAVHGPLTESLTLENAGIRIADTLFSLTDSDALNASIVERAKKHYSVPLVIALANNPMNVELLYSSGSDFVLSPVDSVVNEVKALLSIDRPTELVLPRSMSMNFIVLRPVNSISLIDSIFEKIPKMDGVKSIAAFSLSDGREKDIREIVRGDIVEIAVKKSRSGEILKKLMDILKGARG
ncbi:MAG: NAD(P)-binding protein [Fervidicoccaceae archaeon]